MARAFKRLERVLALEKQQDYQDKAVVGGIHQFAVYWVAQAQEEAQDEADKALIEQTSEVLMEYGRLPGKEARAKAIDGLMASLQRRQERIGSEPQSPQRPSQPAKKKNTQKTPTSRKQKPKSAHKTTEPEPEPVDPDPAGLSQSIQILPGIGPKLAEKINKLGAHTIWEYLYIFPRRYDDYTLMKPINRLVYGDQVTIIGTIWQTRAQRMRNSQVMVRATINDGTGAVQATWFNQPWLTEKLHAGMQVVISGKVEQFLGRPVFNSPQWEPLEIEPLRTRRIVPVYPLTEGLTSKKMRDTMRTAVTQWAPRIPDPLPINVSQRQNLYSLPQAVAKTHFPDTQENLHKARRRIMFDELFMLQLGMQGQRHEWQSQPGMPLQITAEQFEVFRAELPFKFTNAQEKVTQEILADIRRDVPMNRLLQGDVGAGKTVVAAAGMFAAVRAGAQSALMAPTEILAEQHFKGLSMLLAPLNITIEQLTGSTSAAEKERIYASLADGTTQIVIGTHALIQESVTFKQLGLAVIDEQHRFGVEQRGALRQKGPQTETGTINPHLLVMSATPIPRTLALSLYGDLDLSILDEMPPGRQEIKTRWLRTSERERAYTFVRKQVLEGRQAYIIFPLVEESENIDAKAAVEEFEVLQNAVFADLKVGLVHGRLSSSEKEAAMRAFYAGETDILVATSVIEVGVDVPNSTVMVIEGANRFGLAQLHQFRGRVGRGEHQSYCILVADDSSTDSEKRLQALEQTNDGFILAEKDLELRGPGEFFGRRQSGLPELQMASLLDMELLEIAQQEAQTIFAADPLLEQPEHAALRDRVAKFWAQAGDVS